MGTSMTETHQKEYTCFISILTRLYLLNVPNWPFGKRMLTGLRLVGCSFYSHLRKEHVLFSFSLKTRVFLVTLHRYRCFSSILTRPYIFSVFH